MSPCQQFNQPLISRRQLEGAQVSSADPRHVLTKLRNRLIKQSHAPKVQSNRPLSVGVFNSEDLLAHFASSGEFFFEFPCQTPCVRLARFTLAAGKFPCALQVSATQSSRHQKAIVAFDHGSEYDNNRTHRTFLKRGFDAGRLVGLSTVRQPLFMGQVGQSGARAEQTVAPKSISA